MGAQEEEGVEQGTATAQAQAEFADGLLPAEDECAEHADHEWRLAGRR